MGLRLIVLAVGALVGGSAAATSANPVKEWAVDRQARPAPSVKLVKLAGPPRGFLAPTSRKLRTFGGHASTAGTGYPDNLFRRSDHVTGTSQLPPWFVSFQASGRDFHVFTKGTGGKLRIRVDGRLAGRGARQTPVNGSLYAYVVKFRSAKKRTVVLEMGNGFFFGGVRGRISRDRTRLGPRVIFVGDSFTEPQGANVPTSGYAHRAAFRLGWGDAWSSGSGGTGYLNSGAKGRSTIGGRLASDVLAHRPARVVLAAGINDVGRQSAAEVAAAARKVIDRIRASGAELLVVGPFWPGDPSAAATEVDSAIRQEALAAGVPFVSPMAEGWITSSNAGQFIGPDGTHPTQAGHDHLGARVAEALRAAGLD